MDFKGIVAINLYSIIILSIVYIYTIKNMDKQSLQNKVYSWLLRVGILLLVIEVLSRFDGNPDSIYLYINHLGNFLLFLLNPTLPILWFVYVHCNIYHVEDKTKKLFVPLILLFFTNAVLVILSQFYGWFYYIDKANIYHRGDYYLASASISIALIIMSFVLMLKNRTNIEKSLFLPLMIFGLIPTIAIIFQIIFYGLSLMLSGVSISLLVAFINIQIKNMYTDYLTGVCNRNKLEIILKEKIESSSKGKSFSALMIDLNNFKSINDTYGHDVGDNALKVTAKLLSSCLRANDYVSRFGGDEFYVVVDICDEERLKALISRIKNCFKSYNYDSGLPYKLSFSMGYAIYDYNSHMTVEEFQKQLDELLYENKRAIK